MDKISVYILAGGKSRRFGSDKARALLSGGSTGRVGAKPLVLHVADALRGFAARITVVADRVGKYDDLGLKTIADIEPGLGPLGGLATALADCPEPWLLLASCDFPGLRPGWIATLLDHRSDDDDAVAFRSDRWQPMPAIYRRTFRAPVDEFLRLRRDSFQQLLSQSKVKALAIPEDWPAQSGINSPEDLRDWTGTLN